MWSLSFELPFVAVAIILYKDMHGSVLKASDNFQFSLTDSVTLIQYYYIIYKVFPSSSLTFPAEKTGADGSIQTPAAWKF